MMATEMPAAMRPYSMAVAPDSLRKKRVKRLTIASSCHSFGADAHRMHAFGQPSGFDFCGSATSVCLGEFGRDLSERRFQLAADALHDRDDGNRDAGGDQAIFDGGRTGLIFDKARNEGFHGLAP